MICYRQKPIALSISLGLGLLSFSPAILAGQPPQWRRMTAQEETQTWQYILNSPLGIAALNQLAIEGFISPVCQKTWSIDKTGFSSLLTVKCPEPRGVSIAVSYQEIKVRFNRFEDNIENFTVERITSEK